MAKKIDLQAEIQNFRRELAKFCKEHGYFLEQKDATINIDNGIISFYETIMTTGKLLADKDNLKKDDEAIKLENVISESISKSLAELFKMEEKGRFLLYLWIATATGITLREACERYTIKRECGFSGSLMFPSMVTDCTLEPRKEPIIIDSKQFAAYQMKAAKFLQDIIEGINKNH